ncbi:hypothetical protein JCM10135_10010 [Stetteria hydrogenophila]
MSIDGYSSVESRPWWVSWRDWGWRAVAAALSDVVAAGGEPFAVVVSLGVRRPGDALEVMEGVREAAVAHGVAVAGGDLNRAFGEEWIDVAVVGRPLRWVRRAGAEPGDAVVQVGELGYGGLAQAVTDGRLRVDDVPRSLLERAARPRVPRGFELVARECGVKAAIDNSDGWAYSLAQLAAASGVSVRLDRVVVDEEVGRVVEEHGLGPVDRFGLNSWEDYNIAAAVARSEAECVLEHCERLGLKCWLVGEIVEARGALVAYKGEAVEIKGWSSFPEAGEA